MRHTHGSIEVICGSMFSGKTDELIRRLVRATIARQKVQVFKPAIDIRYAVEKVASHAGSTYDAIPVEKAAEIRTRMDADTTVVGIDEAQFFDDEITPVCNSLANSGIRVIIAGLDMDYLAKPFGPMPALLASAEYIDKIHAICMSCGDLAHYSHRMTADDQQIVLGEKDVYEPLCRKCYLEKHKNSSVF